MNIRDLDQFAKSRLILHDNVNNLLPRNIRVSDIDFVLDNQGDLLFAEFKLSYDDDLDNEASWDRLPKGQRRMYENLVRAGQGKITVVLCRYKKTDRLPDSLKDVIAFQVMHWRRGEIRTTRSFPGGRDGVNWGNFIQCWMKLGGKQGKEGEE